MLQNTTTNRELIPSMNPLSESFACQDSEFCLDRKLESSPSYSDNFCSLMLEKYLSEDQELLDCGNLMKSPLSSEDIDSVLDSTSLSDDCDVNLLPISSPPSSPESQDIPISSPLSLIPSIPTNESDGIQASGPILVVPLGQTTTTGELSRSSSPCLLVSSSGKEKRTKSYRTKKTPYSRDKSTESISSPIDILAQPQQLSKKEKKKLQNKNAATRYRQKMKEEAEQQKQEEDGLLKENARLKKEVEDIQREIQYLKNLLNEIGKARTKSVKLEQNWEDIYGFFNFLKNLSSIVILWLVI